MKKKKHTKNPIAEKQRRKAKSRSGVAITTRESRSLIIHRHR